MRYHSCQDLPTKNDFLKSGLPGQLYTKFKATHSCISLCFSQEQQKDKSMRYHSCLDLPTRLKWPAFGFCLWFTMFEITISWKYLEFCENIYSHFENIYRLVKKFTGIGNIYRLLKIFMGFWKYLQAFEKYLQALEIFKGFWKYLWASENIYRLLKIFTGFWKIFTGLWKYLQSFENYFWLQNHIKSKLI